jgi:hypothetical protein
VIVAAVMFSAALPVLVSVTVFEALLPMVTLLKATEDGLIASCDCVAVPEPLRLIVSGDPGALLATETLPLALPAVVGENFTVKELVAPGFKVPAENPLSEKPAPEALAADTETGAVPVLVSVTETDPVLPIRTLPKLMLEGFADSTPCVPVPLSAMERVGLVAFVEIAIVPEAAPAAVGANVAVKLACAPAAIA